MKSPFICAIFSFLLFAAGAVYAEDVTGTKADLGATSHPPVATAEEVAMSYWQLAHQSPKFDVMALQTDAYKNANSFEKDQVKEAQVAYLKNAFDSVTFTHPMVFALKVRLSPYSDKNRGFMIKDIDDQTFFKFTYAGENYAVVPRGLTDHQFMGPIPDDSYVSAIKLAWKTSGDQFALLIFVKPDYADPPATMTEMDGQMYHVISGAVSHVSMYDLDEQQQLWGDDSQEFNKQQSNDLLNLKQ
jgi:hypothetical protein